MTSAAYDDIADWYETAFLPYQRRGDETGRYADTIGIDRALVDLLGSGRGTCLEVGCGTGIYADRVRSLGWTPVGVDLSAGMLRHASGRLPAARGDANRLPFRSGSIEAAIGVMIHSDLPAFDTVLDEVGRVLRPDGVFVHIGVHPCFIGSFADRSDPAGAVIAPGYRDEGWTPAIDPSDGAVGTSGQVRDKVGAAHYTLATVLNAFADRGFRVVQAAEGGEPTPITFSMRTIRSGPAGGGAPCGS